MAGVRFADLRSRPMEFLDCTSVTLDEFQQLVSPFEAAFQARMTAWRMDGKPRTARRFSVYQNCPLPTPEDRLLFILLSPTAKNGMKLSDQISPFSFKMDSPHRLQSQFP